MIFKALALLLALTVSAHAQTVSYWAQGFDRQPSAELAQQYFFHAGPGISITFTNPYVYINATGGGGGGGGTNVSFATNAFSAIWSTNWTGSNAMWLLLQGNPFGFPTNFPLALTNLDTRQWTNANTLYVGEVKSYSPQGRFDLTPLGYLYLTGPGAHTINLDNDASFYPKIDFGGNTVRMTHDFSATDRSLIYRPGLGQGIEFWNDGKISIGNNFGSAAGDAFYVDQANTKVVLKSGIDLIIGGIAYGNGAGLTNAQFTSQIRSNYVTIQGLATNLNFIPGTNTTVTATNVGGRMDIAVNAAGGGTDANAWHQTGDTVPNTNVFIGTVNNQPMTVKVNNVIAGLFNTNGAVALGWSASANGLSSFATGTNAVASGNYSIAEGFGSLASNLGSVAVGTLSKATGLSDTAIGQGANAIGGSSVAIGGSGASAFGAVSIGLGNAALGIRSFSVGQSAVATGDNSVAMGNDVNAQFQGSFVFADSTGSEYFDTAQDQFVAYFAGGFYLYSSAFSIDDTAGGVVSANSGTLTTSVDAIAKRNVIATNILYAGCVTNVMAGTVGYPTTTTNVPIHISPVGLFGYLGFVGSSTISMGATANVYMNVGSNGLTFNRVLTNGFGASATKAMLTNYVAGYYGVRVSMSALGGGTPSVNGKEFEIEIFVNGKEEDFLSDIVTGTAANNVWGPTHAGIIYLAANSVLDVRIRQTTAGLTADVVATRLYINVGTP